MAASKPGDTFLNPVTGERSILLEAPSESPDQRLVAELHLEPGAAVAGEHLHPTIAERFEVLEGRLAYSLDGREGEAGPGDALDIPAGSWHDWWQEGREKTVCRVTVAPGDRFEQMIRTVWGLAYDGQTDEKGMPSLLQLVAIADEFSDTIVFKRPPPAVQRPLFALLGPLARRRGYRGIYPRYAEGQSGGTPEQVRAGESFEVRFGDGAGPPGMT